MPSVPEVRRARLAPDRAGASDLEPPAADEPPPYRAIVESLEEGIWVVDHEGRTTFVNTAMAAMLGFEPGEMVGMTTRYLTGRGSGPTGICYDLTRRGGTHDEAICFRHRDGRDVWARVSTAPVATGTDAGAPPMAGTGPAMIALVTDVTEQRQVDEALRRERERFRAMVQHCADPILVVKDDGAIDYASPAIESVLGFTPAEVRGRDIGDLLFDEEHAAEIRAGLLAPATTMGSSLPNELGFRHQDGSLRSCEVSVHDLVDDPSVGGIVVNVRDVTATRLAERRLHTLLESCNDIIVVLQDDGEWFASPAGTRILGHPPGFEPPGGLISLIHPDDVALAAAALDEVRAGRRDPADGIEVRARAADGTYRWLELVARNLSEDPLVRGIVITARDIASRREADAALKHSEAWFRALVQNQTDIISVIDNDAIFRYISPNAEHILGFSVSEIEGTNALDRIHPDDQDALINAIGAQVEPGTESRPVEYRQLRADGTWIWLEATTSALAPEFEIDGIIVNTRDVSEKHRAEEDQRRSEQEFRDAFKGSPSGIAFGTLDGILTWVNTALSAILDVPESVLLGAGIDVLDGAGDNVADSVSMEALLAGDIPSFTTERRYDHRDGSTVWGLLHVSLVRDGSGAPRQLLSQVEDITENKQRELDHRYAAEHDPLTGAWNRAGMKRLLDGAWQNREAEHPLALLFADIDGFKAINDSYGHAAGDEVLEHVARRLRGVVRAGDHVARWGGDEFLVLCPGVRDEAEAAGIAERLREVIAAPFQISVGDIGIGLSVGVALDEGHDSPERLLREADAASYKIKLANHDRAPAAEA